MSDETPEMNVVARIDAWENTWFPIAEAALGRKFPNVKEHLFRNLRQVEGPEVVVSVMHFVRRLDELSDPAAPCGAEGPSALELLAWRGLTEVVIGEAKSLLDLPKRVDRKPWRSRTERGLAELLRRWAVLPVQPHKKRDCGHHRPQSLGQTEL